MPEYHEQKPVSSTIVIWDTESLQPIGDWTTLLWRSYKTDGRDDVLSIPQLIEDNAVSLRARYLAWVYESGEVFKRSKRIVDHLELRPGFSYWWMTLIAEKCNFSKSPQIDQAIRLIAFDDWAQNRFIGSIVLVSANSALAECIRGWCACVGSEFEYRPLARLPVQQSRLKRIYRFAPHAISALLWLLRYLIDRWSLRGIGLKEWRETDGRVTFFSYLFNLVPDKAKQGRYESRYWGHLPDTLQGEACQTNWLHLYVKDSLLPTSKQAAATICKFNKNSQGKQNHVTLDTFLSPLIIFRSLFDWFRLLWTGIGLGNQICLHHNKALDLWPLFKEDWRQSMFGSVAMSNLLYLNLFESALECLPQQKYGVYLQENQAWEFALIHAWKVAGHGRLIGTPHSTVRYWDLRYFFDPRSYQRSGQNDLPMPDRIAYNGYAAFEAYKHGEYPVEDLVEVEALRYLHLNESKAKTASVPVLAKNGMRVLVLGDYLDRNTQRQMTLLEQAVPLLPLDTVFIVKPHPACPIRSADYPVIHMTLTMEPISKLLTECDVAYSSAVTSAAVDAYCTCIPVVSMLDPNTLNLSPLRGCAGALFATTPEELADGLISAAAMPRIQADRQAFFTLDSQLPRWLELIRDSVE